MCDALIATRQKADSREIEFGVVGIAPAIDCSPWLGAREWTCCAGLAPDLQVGED